VSDSLKAAFKIAGSVVLALALCLGLVVGLAACGGDDATDGTGDATTTLVEDVAAVTAESRALGTAVAIDDALIGSWHSEETGETLQFTVDGALIITSDTEPGTTEYGYGVVEGTVVISFDGAEGGTAGYSIDGDILTMDDPVGQPVTYDRVQ
jgi:hypothetical protein